ncbi:MAG: N-acetylglutaminylglutamine synthetase [Alphaproteobacteria bacterium]|jgi:GNAT-family acetyltransferase (TIGR03103 family)|nr:N-acetylglutaminylglutamine synthetase [Alphaproteobacteria bacterium]MBU2042150.1 N-acetylglutaminylglutamine synthetase [Alphaproteobacteria bacterium]MBU2126395.1 N-acetylglutaminylglutamine synthetase [Alphaproteobacteria bacterium]MBU2209784.1 N-acetylglutaminylglutamine synthetase [Alphaproteobacteria bacterium]MBU2292097.1 N-acetylglutaminylglutamine synthetase [Alphaproteobacteria bacterium]
MASDVRPRRAAPHRLKRLRHEGLKPLVGGQGEGMAENAVLDCGWGRLLFAQTFPKAEPLIEALRAEGPDRRDIALYVRNPHVLLASAPQEVFLDPSHTFRLDLATYRPGRRQPRGFTVRRLVSEQDAEEVNRIYAARGMVPAPSDFLWSHRDDRNLTYLVAEDSNTGAVIGTVTGVNHVRAFSDPENGSSLWCLAVDPQATQPGVGEALVRRLAEHFKTQGLAFMDLSVMHDNEQAIALYEKLGFRRVSFFGVKRKNPINEVLFTGPADGHALNPYARIIVDEARRRGIATDVIDAEGGLFRLTWGGRSIRCRESLSELTSSVALSICDDKRMTRRIVEQAGVRVPERIGADDPAAIADALSRHGALVVKPARGEQGKGVAVGLTTEDDVAAAIAAARRLCPEVLVEEQVQGEDLRLVVIDFKVVAAALRRPPRVVGDGRSTLRALIEHQSRRRAAATGGESTIPIDAETERCLAAAGYGLDDVAPEGVEVMVRKAANLHLGGTIHDVTSEVHPALIRAAVAAARAIDISVTGIDLMVKSPREPAYAFIEANERPGLANHEPQPTAERFIDLLFPLSAPASVRAAALPAVL